MHWAAAVRMAFVAGVRLPYLQMRLLWPAMSSSTRVVVALSSMTDNALHKDVKRDRPVAHLARTQSPVVRIVSRRHLVRRHPDHGYAGAAAERRLGPEADDGSPSDRDFGPQ